MTTEQPRGAENRPERLSTAQSSPEQPRAAQSSPEQPRAAQNSPEQPKAAQNSPGQPRATQSALNSPEQPRAAPSSPAPPNAAQSSPEPPKATLWDLFFKRPRLELEESGWRSGRNCDPFFEPAPPGMRRFHIIFSTHLKSVGSAPHPGGAVRVYINKEWK